MADERMWLALLAATLATYVWRALAVAVSSHISPTGPVFKWFGCVAYGMVAGLIARMILMPVGVLNQAPTVDRIGAAACGLVVFFVFRRNVFVGTFCAVVAFIAIAYTRRHL